MPLLNRIGAAILASFPFAIFYAVVSQRGWEGAVSVIGIGMFALGCFLVGVAIWRYDGW